MTRDSNTDIIDEYMTKQGKRILCAIYDKGQIMSSELAECLGISRNAMSNSLERIKKSPIPVVWDEKYGRTRIYSLTEEGREYVETIYEVVKAEILIENSKRRDKKLQESDTKKQIMECMKELEEEDICWSDKLQHLGGLFGMKQLQQHIFVDKIKQLIAWGLKAKIGGEESTYKWFISAISNRYIRDEIDHAIRRREGLSFLWDMVSENYERAYRVTEIVFRPGDFITAGNMISELVELNIEIDTVYKLIFAMQSVVTQAKNRGVSKEEFLELLVEEGAQKGPFIYYLTEKYINIL